MKNLKTIFALMLLLSLAVVSCKKDEKDLNENISPIGALSLPANEASIKLTPSNAAATQQFKWTSAVPEDGGLILY